jgi:formiminotetrahydrofolate cyclodeaminase
MMNLRRAPRATRSDPARTIGVVSTADSEPVLDERPLPRMLEDLAHGRAAAAGGVAAATTAALAAAVVTMAARAARPKWTDAGGAIAQSEALRARLTALAGRDAEAYGRARALLQRAGRDRDRRGSAAAPSAAPSETPEERERRLAEALDVAAREPLLIAEAAAEVAQVAAWVAHGGSADHRADAATAAVLAESAATAAAHLVEINPAVGTDSELAVRARAAAKLAAEARSAALPAGG